MRRSKRVRPRMENFWGKRNKAMNYRSIVNLNSDIKKWIPELPNGLDLIVGIPRSGLLVANLLALHLNLHITNVEGLIEITFSQWSQFTL